MSRNSTRNPLNLIQNPRFLQTPLVKPLVFTMHLGCTLLILLFLHQSQVARSSGDSPFRFLTRAPLAMSFKSTLRSAKSPISKIASDFGSQTQIAALFAVSTYRTVELRIASCAFRLQGYLGPRIARGSKSLAILDLDHAISPTQDSTKVLDARCTKSSFPSFTSLICGLVACFAVAFR